MKLIDKGVLIAEIERRRNKNSKNKLNLAAAFEDNYLLSFIDTLEVKEVDLEKEIDKFYGMYRKNGITFSIEDNQECLDWKVDCNPNFVKAFAKHFFNLGLKHRKENNMTDKQIIKLSNNVLTLSIDLSSKLQKLARAASERLGYDVVVDLCNGAEIEFRVIKEDGVADSDSCIRLEDILVQKEK